MAGIIDWDLAGRTAKKVSPAAPTVARDEADQVVADLYRASEVAAAHVAELTGLTEPPVTAITRVVDRSGWVEVNVAGMRTVMAPFLDKLSNADSLSRVTESIGGRVTGLQAGAVIGFLSGKVLGQFEFFDRPAGQLLLVAPNLVAVERQLEVTPADFRLWVCLHEVTHRVQFTAVPWMAQHMRDLVQALSDTVDANPDALRQRVREAISELAKVSRGQGNGDGIISMLATPEQRAVLEQVTAFMSVVEGHAEYVMNAVSPSIIPSQPLIEARFAQRRRGGNPLDRLLRKVLGLDAKTRQYVDGSSFVRAIVDTIGLQSFNAIWADPTSLPTKAEIADPAAWIARVHR